MNFKDRLLARLRRKRGTEAIDLLLRQAMRQLWEMRVNEGHFMAQLHKYLDLCVSEDKIASFNMGKTETQAGYRFDVFYTMSKTSPTFVVSLHVRNSSRGVVYLEEYPHYHP